MDWLCRRCPPMPASRPSTALSRKITGPVQRSRLTLYGTEQQMELKEARYILAIARHQSIGKAAESLYISQPSLSKYLKNIEERLGAPLFNRRENHYYPTYIGERYLHYAEQIVACGDEWRQEYSDISKRSRGRLNIAVPIMMGSTVIEPTLPEFHRLYPLVTLNVLEAVNFVAESANSDPETDLTIYNVHEFPTDLDYQILHQEEIVLVLRENHPLAAYAEKKDGFRHPWIDLKLFAQENFILLYPDQNTGGIALELFKDYGIQPPILLHTRNSAMSIRLAMAGLGAAFAPESYFRHELALRGGSVDDAGRTHNAAITGGADPSDSTAPGGSTTPGGSTNPGGNVAAARCYSIGRHPILTTTIAAYHKNHYLPQHARDYIALIQDYFRREII